MKRSIMIIVAVGIASLVPGFKVGATDFCSEPVETAQGKISGFTDADYGSCTYRGIPFAMPPVGERRLKRPEPPEAHSGVFRAETFGPACMQKPSLTNGGEADEYSEDCLYLNVFRPKKSGTFPVMMWIYGGGYTGGAGSFDLYDGAHQASRNEVVIVTINYRLGPIGFLALPELKEEDGKGSTGNYGILDQVRALEWIRENISAFGGDPDNVTVFGQSAGGMSVCALLVSPEAAGLFHRAMIMSAPCKLFTDLDEGFEKSRAYVEEMGCAGPAALDCIRSQPTKSFKLSSENDLFAGGVSWSPTVDGSFLTDQPLAMIQRGEYYKVPTIISSTRDELRIYTLAIPGLGLWTRGTVNRFLRGLTGPDNSAQIFAMYDYKDFRRPIDLAFAFGNQMMFDTPMYMMAEAMADNNPVWLYRMDWDQTRFPHKMGAFHALDVPFVFGSLNIDADIARLLASEKTYEENTPLAYKMMSYVANFAKTGDPNGEGLPEWPAYTAAARNRMHLNTEITIQAIDDDQVERYEWYAERELEDVLVGSLSRAIGGE
jgi:para-nitrobenzyl esterase